MKKAILIAAAVAALAACSKSNSIEIADNAGDGAIGFGVYSSSVVTKGTVVVTDTIQAVGKKGIGVFAFYQPATNGIPGPDYTTIKYPTPDFMYNQQVNCKTTAGKWEYSPLKYWPNNVGDKLSFFAYAPYDQNTAWEDLGITTDATGSKISKTFIIYPDIEDQKDYLFAEPVLNMLKPDATAISGGKDVVTFNFKHITSKVNLYIGVDSVDRDKDQPYGWADANTTIEVKSIEFKDLAQSFTWSKKGTAAADTTANGAQDIVAYPYTNTATSTNYGLISNGWTAEWHRFLKGAQTGTTQTTTSNDEYMFIAPQALSSQEIVITYVVTTTDPNDPNHFNDSKITNKITKTWSKFFNNGLTELKAGKQYNLYFLIGMQSVKVAATVSDWDTPSTNHQMDVPDFNE